MRNLMTMPVWCAAFFAMHFAAAAAWGQAADKKLEIHEWGVWGTSPNLETANDETRYPTAMPVIVETSRTVAADRIKAVDGLTPVTIMTFHGDPATDVDVGIRSQAGRIPAHWPRGTTSDRRTRWNHVNLFNAPPADQRYAIVAEEHWFNRARQLDTLHLKVGTRDERFVTYDPVVKWVLPLELKGGPDKFTLVNTGKVPLYDVALSVPSPEGRRMAWVDVLPAAEQPKQPEQPAGAPLAVRQTIEAHPGGANVLAVSANGQLAASAGEDLKIKIWQVADGKLMATFDGHTAPITGLTFIPNSDKLASVGRDKTLRIWNVAQATSVSSDALSDEGLCLATSNDGKHLIAGSKDGKGLIVDAIEGKTIAKSYAVHRDNFQAAFFAPDRRLLVTGGNDKIGKLWQRPGKTYNAGAGTLKGHNGAVTAVVITPDSKTAITGSADGTVRMWDMQGRKETQSFKQAGPVAGLALSPNGETLAIALAEDSALTLFDLKKNESSGKLDGHKGPIRAVAANGDGAWVTASADGTLKFWGNLKVEPTKLQGPPVEVTLSAPLAGGSADLLAQTTETLKKRLVATGLAQDEVDLLLSMYAKPIFESQKLIVLVRLPQEELDTRLPFDIYPEPTKIVRVALVVVSDIDPRVAGEITTLIAQLGDADYKKREAAETRLAELGPLALPALREALKQSDLELVFRAERLLLAQNQAIEGK